MIKDFPLDYMHLILLGVVKKLLKMWLGVTKVKLNPRTAYLKIPRRVRLSRLAFRQTRFSFNDPSDFERRPRSFKYICMFKATEFRSFLCYTSAAILQKLFQNSVMYDHFMLLVVCMRILLTPNQNETLLISA